MRSSYDYAVLRVVPRVEREECINAGVILFCRTQRYLAARVALDRSRLAALDPATDADEVEQHLDLVRLVCRGDVAAGAIGQLPQAARFHWLTAPRSTVLQPSAVHSGLCEDPGTALERLFETLVTLP